MIRRNLLVLVIGVFFVAACAMAQDLAAVARQQRQNKKNSAPAKVITNDDIQTAPQPAASNAAASTTPADAAKDAKDDKKPKTAVEADEAKRKEFAAKADDLKKQIAEVQRDIDVSEREYKLRAAVYYADAGNSLRDPKAWAQQERDYQAQMADKRKNLADLQQKLNDVQEDARKAGVGNSAN